jgi:phosphohistidine phosphatase
MPFMVASLTDLVLFRHGKAVRPGEAPDDFSRGLTERGRSEARSQAEALRALGCLPDVALVSTALRACQTWDEAAPAFPATQARLNRQLYLATPDIYLDSARTAGAACVMVVAHDPGLHELACSLLRGNAASPQAQLLKAGLPTAGVVWFEADARVRSGWRLVRFLSPGASVPG